MDFVSVLDVIPNILGKIEGPLGVISLIIILFSFITWGFFNRESIWFRVFAIMLLFVGAIGLSLAVLSPSEQETVRDDTTDQSQDDSAADTSGPSANVQTSSAQGTGGSEGPDTSSTTQEKPTAPSGTDGVPPSNKNGSGIETPEVADNEVECNSSVQEQFDSACLYVDSPNSAHVMLTDGGTYFAIYARGPARVTGYVSDTCPDTPPPPGVFGCVMMDEPLPGTTKRVYGVTVGTTLVARDADSIPMGNQTVNVSFPGCEDGDIKAYLGPLNAQTGGWSGASSSVSLTRNFPTPYEETLVTCGTAGEMVVQYMTQAGGSKEVSFSRFDLFRGLIALRNIYSQF